MAMQLQKYWHGTKDNSPFADRENGQLVSFNTGLISVLGTDQVNADMAEDVGRELQKLLDGRSFKDKMPTKEKVKPLSHLKKAVKVKDKKIILDNLKLFNRLMIVGERELSINESLRHELTTLPMSLFSEDQFMRKANKASFGNHLKDLVVPVSECYGIKTSVIDGGWLIHQIKWVQGKTFGEVSKSYIAYVKQIVTRVAVFDVNVIIVFDGYQKSTKDHEHQRRNNKSCPCPAVAVSSTTVIPFTKAKLLNNNENKACFIQLLRDAFQSNGIQVIMCDCDADTTIVKTVLECGSQGAVNVIADDTDILVSLVYHIKSIDYPVYITSSNKIYDVKAIRDKLSHTQERYLLVAYSFSGCDTVSSIFGHGKVALFKWMTSQFSPSREALDVFRDPHSSVEEIKGAGYTIFCLLYSKKSKSKTKKKSPVLPPRGLDELRQQTFSVMIAKGVIRPEKLPPTKSAAEQHSLRAYLQLQEWTQLSNSLDPERYDI